MKKENKLPATPTDDVKNTKVNGQSSEGKEETGPFLDDEEASFMDPEAIDWTT